MIEPDIQERSVTMNTEVPPHWKVQRTSNTIIHPKAKRISPIGGGDDRFRNKLLEALQEAKETRRALHEATARHAQPRAGGPTPAAAIGAKAKSVHHPAVNGLRLSEPGSPIKSSELFFGKRAQSSFSRAPGSLCRFPSRMLRRGRGP